MRRLMADLGHPEDRLPPVIHVAGTNGKGSTVAHMRAIAEAAGLRVHVFTSPHLVRFVERIRLAGTLITEEALAAILERVEAANAGQPITFFEITAAAAFVAFAETPADLLLLEVGLGGVLDATNIIPRTAVSVIAPVDYDHREFLGDDLASIAGEKSGVIKRGAPVVSARQQDVARQVIERQAARLGAPLQMMGEAFDAALEDGRLVFRGEDRLLDLPPTALVGDHQIDNAALAIAALLAWGDPRIDDDAIARGLRAVSWPARMQRLTAGPYAGAWLDGGHNPHGARAVAAAMAGLARDGRPVALIAGTLANKDAHGFFAAFKALGPKVYAIGFDADAAAPAARTAEAARAAGLTADVCTDVAEAYAKAEEAHVLICGSLYLAGEVLAASPATWPT